MDLNKENRNKENKDKEKLSDNQLEQVAGGQNNPPQYSKTEWHGMRMDDPR